MARKSKGKFNMKGHTLPGIKQVAGKMGDGRASSSPFQMKPAGDSPNNFLGFGGGRPIWKSVLDPLGIFGQGNKNQNPNANLEQPGQTYAKANFDQMQTSGADANTDPNITQATTTQPVTTQPVVNQELAMAETGNPPVAMKSPVKNYKKGYYKSPVEQTTDPLDAEGNEREMPSSETSTIAGQFLQVIDGILTDVDEGTKYEDPDNIVETSEIDLGEGSGGAVEAPADDDIVYTVDGNVITGIE